MRNLIHKYIDVRTMSIALQVQLYTLQTSRHKQQPGR